MDDRSTSESYGQLIAADPAIAQRSYQLIEDIYTIGRAVSCQIIVYDDRKLVSRVHATIERSGLRYMLHDANSANGTFVNGQRIQRSHMLTHDDAIGLGAPRELLRFVDPDPTAFANDDLVYNPQSMTFLIGKKAVDLTHAQHKLLMHLYNHAYSVCTKEACAEALWGANWAPGMDAGTLDQAISMLRKRLAEVKPDMQFIQTKRGLGYMLVPSGQADDA